ACPPGSIVSHEGGRIDGAEDLGKLGAVDDAGQALSWLECSISTTCCELLQSFSVKGLTQSERPACIGNPDFEGLGEGGLLRREQHHDLRHLAVPVERNADARLDATFAGDVGQ